MDQDRRRFPSKCGLKDGCHDSVYIHHCAGCNELLELDSDEPRKESYRCRECRIIATTEELTRRLEAAMRVVETARVVVDGWDTSPQSYGDDIWKDERALQEALAVLDATTKKNP